MVINNNYIVVKKVEKPPRKEGEFEEVEIVDSSVYKGEVIELPEIPVFIGNTRLDLGSIVMFAKYSPDTHEITEGGQTVKFIKITDILKVY